MKNILILTVVLSFLSCTKEIYRGVVTYTEPNRQLVQLYGTNQSVWTSNDSLSMSDIAQVETKNNFKKVKTTLICSPVLGHCHLVKEDSGEIGTHSKIHIRTPLIEPRTLEYSGRNYISTTMSFEDDSEIYGVWLEENYDFNAPDSINAVLLLDENFSHQRIQQRSLVVDYTREDHVHIHSHNQ